jgi:protein SCO1/2
LSARTAPLGFGSAVGWAKRPGNSRIVGVALIAALLAVAAFSSTALWEFSAHNPRTAPDFTLIDQNGQPFTLSKIQGHPIALFFGFTHCPDECPTTLAHLAHAVHAPSVPNDTRVVFITVDPGRDSPATLKRYVGLFDPHFIGLTGGLSRLNPVYDAYHVARRVIRVNDKLGDDSFEHGTAVYYIGRDGVIKDLGQWDDAAAAMARDFRDIQ